jgi:phenylacetate-CoA ligase
MAGLAYMQGARKLGCPVVRMGPGAVGMQIDSIRRFSTAVMVAVPSFVHQMINFARRKGIDLNNLTVKKVICIGEPVRADDMKDNALGAEIRKAWNVELYSTYASTEMSTAFSECNGFCGGHLNPELGILEVLDENNKQVSNGQTGEIVFTSLGVEGMPLLRYRTGDIAVYLDGVCSCGSISPRVGPIIGRKRQRIKYKGTTIYPGEIIGLMHQHQGKIPYVIEIDSDEYGNDLLSIRIGISPEGKDQFKAWFQENLRVIPELICDDPGNIEKLRINADMRKPRQVIDLR